MSIPTGLHPSASLIGMGCTGCTGLNPECIPAGMQENRRSRGKCIPSASCIPRLRDAPVFYKIRDALVESSPTTLIRDLRQDHPALLIAAKRSPIGVTIHYMTSKKIAVVKKTGTRPGYHHIGCDVETKIFDAIRAEARENGVPYSVIQRWALESYLAHRLSPEKEDSE